MMEVLAPARDHDCLLAALRAGADAVYFGLHDWNARARAQNFDPSELEPTLRLLHSHGRKGYLALNTLVFDHELEALADAVRLAADAGVDALLVQDLGVARLAREIAPGLRLHASTQMTCTDAGSVAFAGSLGVRRVVLARELSLLDIAAIRESTDLELEVFVHGALCIAYSGQCLTSEAVGGRSANRGACAQACRLPYELLVDGVRRDLGDCAYLLSPQDLEASALIPDLVALKVDAVKIEGRLKGPAYVAATTLLYRRAVDAALGHDVATDPTLRPMALQTFTRGSGHGFLQGVDHQALVEGRSCDHRGLQVGSVTGTTLGRVVVRLSEPIARGDGILIEGGFAGDGEVGGRVWSLSDERGETPSAEAGQVIRVGLGPDVRIRATEGRRVWKTSDPSLERAVFAKLPDAPRRPLDLVVTANHGECARLEGIAGDVHASVQADTPILRATSATSSLDAVKSKLARLGDTPFVLRNLELRLPSDALWPVSSINRARRALVEALVAGSHRSIPTATVSWAPKGPTGPLPPPGLFVLCRTLAQAEAALDAGADGVYLDFLGLTGTGDAFRALRARGHGLIGVAPPRVRKPGEETIDRFLADLGPDMTLVRGLGALGETSLQPRIGDFSLNVANGLAASEVLARGLTAFTPCFDLDATELVTFLDSSFGPYAELVVHHPMALFYMEHCVFAALLSKGRDSRSCGRPCDLHRIALRDRAGHEHPVMADVGCRNTVFHGSAQSAAELIPKVLASGVRRFRIELVTETQESTTCIVTTYRALLEGTVTSTEVWRTLQAQEGYGVVRGSLRVCG